MKEETQSWNSGTHLFILEQKYFSSLPALSAQVLPLLLAQISCSVGVISLKGAWAAENLRKLGVVLQRTGDVTCSVDLMQKLPLSHDCDLSHNHLPDLQISKRETGPSIGASTFVSPLAICKPFSFTSFTGCWPSYVQSSVSQLTLSEEDQGL